MSPLYLDSNKAGRWRQFARIKQDAMAHDLGVTQAMISRWEHGEHPVSAERVNAMIGFINDALAGDGIAVRCGVADLVEVMQDA